MELLTGAEMRAAEAAAIASGAVTGLTLMERAGAGAVEAAAAAGLLPAPGEASVFCGPGANGGDGFVIARLLLARGWRVSAFLMGREDRLPPDAGETLRRWRETGGAVAPFSPGAGPRRAALVVDALFGTGLARPLGPDARAAWQALDGGGPVLAVDAPSGLCLDTGRDLGVVRPADLTATFHRPKRGHCLGAGPDLCGRLAVVDIGIAPCAASTRLARPDSARLAKRGGAHKYDHGHALVIAGGPGRGGAARLAARAALRAGAGLVTVGAPAAAMVENAARLDAVMLREIGDAAALAAALGDRRIAAVLLGPGLGTGEATRAMTLAALAAGRGRAVVLDAEALSAFADAPETLLAACRGHAVLMTPHEGEFGRLFPDLAARLADPADALGRIGAAEAAAARAGSTVLLKGRDTVIAAPGGGAVVSAAAYDRAAPWLATAGSGDVLAGIATGLAARGFALSDAAETASWLHVEAARRFGPGLIAEDLVEALPGALAAALRSG